MLKPKVISIVGPTAAGKTGLSIEIAKQFDGEIISVDSRQVYRGLDIGSGKVTEEEKQNIPHHLLDVINIDKVYTGADFKSEAEKVMSEIVVHNKLPIIAGGTFFYVELLRGDMQAAPVEPNYDLREELEQYSDTELLAQLREKDPERADNIDPHNRRRLIRALEIIDTLGKVPEVVKRESPYEWLTIGIDISKEQLHQNIKTRLEERFSIGMIDEVASLISSGVSHDRLEELGLEYRYISLYLRGELSMDDMRELLETRIRQFAKRQMTWLKRDDTIEWYSLENRMAIFERIETFLNT